MHAFNVSKIRNIDSVKYERSDATNSLILARTNTLFQPLASFDLKTLIYIVIDTVSFLL